MSKKINLSEFIFYLTIILFPILPSYFRLIPSLMMYSALMFLCIIVCFRNRKIRNIKHIRFMIPYILLNLLCFCYHCEINEIIKLFLAPIGLCLVMLKMINSKQRFYKVVDLIIWTGGVVCIIGIIQEFTGYNLFSLLNNSGYAEPELSSRMGLYRIYTSFLMPINYANYLMVMLALTIYRLNVKNFRYVRPFRIILYLILINLVFTGSRATLIASIVLYLILIRKAGTARMLTEIVRLIVVITIAGLVGLLIGINVFSTFSNVINMILGLFDSSYLSKITSDFGGNKGGIGDRIKLYSWVWDGVKDKIVFGIGRSGKKNFVIYRNQWSTKTSIENEYLATLLVYGLVGLVGELTFLVSSVKKSILLKKIKNTDEKIPFYFMATIALIAYLCVFFTVSLQMDERIFFVFIGLILCYKKVFAINNSASQRGEYNG